MLRLLCPLLLSVLAGCAVPDYAAAPVGRFEGSALVVWVGPGDEDVTGDGQFLYVPRDGDALRFVRGDGAAATPGNEVIAPGAFYTNGGSIPRSVQNLRGFNAWAFGPAYIVHDWLFVVRKCVNDGAPDALADPIANMTFAESARIMAETIKTVSVQYDIASETSEAGQIIAPVTAGPISRALWDRRGACATPTIAPQHQDIVDDINRPRATRTAAAPTPPRDGVGDPQAIVIAPEVPPYVIVGTLSFEDE